MASKPTYLMVTLVRCGETAWDREGRLRGRADLPLTEAGRAEIVAGVSRFGADRPSMIYHPADEAATESARILADALGAKTKQVEDLADPGLGLFEGLREQELGERYPKRRKQWLEDPLSLIPPEGEPIADARARLFRAVARLLRRTKAREVAIVLPPLAFGFLRCWFADRPPDHVWRVLGDGCRVERYAVSAGHVERLRGAVRAAEVG